MEFEVYECLRFVFFLLYCEFAFLKEHWVGFIYLLYLKMMLQIELIWFVCLNKLYGGKRDDCIEGMSW